MLPRPFGGQVGEAGKPHAMGESALDGRFDEIGREEGSEIVIFAFRMLHFSRFAMLSGVAVTPAISSSSQRRPRAIDATMLREFRNVSDERVWAMCLRAEGFRGAGSILSFAKRHEEDRQFSPSDD